MTDTKETFNTTMEVFSDTRDGIAKLAELDSKVEDIKISNKMYLKRLINRELKAKAKLLTKL